MAVSAACFPQASLPDKFVSCLKVTWDLVLDRLTCCSPLVMASCNQVSSSPAFVQVRSSVCSGCIHSCLNMPQLVLISLSSLLISRFRHTAQASAECIVLSRVKIPLRASPQLGCHHCSRPTALKPAWVC